MASNTVLTDRLSGEPRGFGFVEMSTAEAARAAIAKLDEPTCEGRNLIVNIAKAPGDSGARRSPRW